MRWLWLVVVVGGVAGCERDTATPPTQTSTAVASPKCDRDTHWAVGYEECEKECKEGSSEACYLAARMHWGNRGVVGDERGFSLSERGCELGSGKSCALASSFYSDGRGGTKDPAKEAEYGHKAVGLFEKECETGNIDSCEQLGWWYANGFSVERDPDKARALRARYLKLAKASCQGGDGPSCARLGLKASVELEDLSQLGTAIDTPTPPDKEALSRAFYKQGCDHGYMPACVEYADGIYEEDHAKALSLLEMACQRGYGKACNRRATKAFGTPEYEHYNRLGCERFDASSCSRIGRDDLACKYGRKHACTKAQ